MFNNYVRARNIILNLKIMQLYTRGCIIMNCKSKYFL